MRVGVGRPDSTDPEIVSRHVLSRFDEPAADVRALIDRAVAETERLVMAEADDGADGTTAGTTKGSRAARIE